MHYLTRTPAFGLVLTLFIVQLDQAYSQQPLNYNGAFQVGNYAGNASFGYLINERDTVLQGKFKMERSSLDALLAEEDNSFLFSGAFDNGYPTGAWTFEFGEFQSNKQTQVVDYQYRVLVSGIQEEASGRISQGKPDGLWEYEVNNIEDSKVLETVFKSSIAFENGVPQKSFKIKNTNNTLVGRFLRDGLAHDEWSLFALDAIGSSEHWYFNEGVLERIRIEKEGRTRNIIISGKSAVNTKTIELDAAYLKTVRILQTNESGAHFPKSQMESLLAQNSGYYKKLDAILSKLGKSAFLPEFKVKVPYYPLDSLETATMEVITAEYSLARAISDSLLNNTQLAILRLSDPEADYLYQVVDHISDTYLNKLQSLTELQEAGILEFATRKQVFQKIVPELPAKEFGVLVEKDSVSNIRSFSLASADESNFSGTSLTTFQQLMSFALHSLEYVEPLLDKKLSKNRRQQQLLALEKELIAENKVLEQLLDTVNATMPSAHKKALEHIKAVTDSQLRDFSSAEEVENARVLLECYRSMNKLAQAIVHLPEQSEEIAEKYTDRVWNPFMANLMDEEVKKRITSAYNKILIPYYLKTAQEETDCKNVNGLEQLIQTTYERLLVLRDEDTGKLERKLKRQNSPKAVLQLFNLPLLAKEYQP